MSDQITADSPITGSPTTIRGEIIAFNISPKGRYESMLLDTDRKIIQVNFSSVEAQHISEILHEGDKVELTAEPERSKHPTDHPVFTLTSLSEDDAVPHAPADERPLPEEERLWSESHPVHVTGKVIRLNYTKHGEVNGAILEDGCFIHLKPEGARVAQLHVGQMIDMDGEEILEAEHRIVDVSKAKDKAIHSSR